MRFSFLILLLTCYSINLSAQVTNVLLAPPGGGVNEPSIMINPINPDQVVAGSNFNYYFYSEDGGNTWVRNHLTSSYGVNGDPCIIVDTMGYFYYFHLSSPVNGSWLDRIVSQRSEDGGKTWSNGTFTGLNGNKDQDKQWAVVDPVNNNIYLTWSEFDEYGSSNPQDSTRILFSKSVDQGITWTIPKKINRVSGDCIDMDNTVEGAVPAVGPDSEIYVSWVGPAGIVFNRSHDLGDTWLDTNIFVSDIPGGWDFSIPGISRCNGLPVTCCDISNSDFRGNIYINWTDQRNGEEDTDVWFKKSTDGGLTWSTLKRVNDDPAGKQQFFSWMTVDQVTGTIWIVFYDRRNHPDNNTDVYLASSVDGGETFTNTIISESSFNPSENIFFGDYTNISAENGMVRPVWTRLDQTELSLLTALINNAVGTAEKPVPMVSITMENIFPNPGNEIAYISFKLKKAERVTLKVFDLYGKEVAVIIENKQLERGKYYESFNISNHNLPHGLYYFYLVSAGQTIVRKMMVK